MLRTADKKRQRPKNLQGTRFHACYHLVLSFCVVQKQKVWIELVRAALTTTNA